MKIASAPAPSPNPLIDLEWTYNGPGLDLDWSLTIYTLDGAYLLCLSFNTSAVRSWRGHYWSTGTCQASWRTCPRGRCPGPGSTSSDPRWLSSCSCRVRSRTCTDCPDCSAHLTHTVRSRYSNAINVKLTANVIIFIVTVDTVPMEVAHIKRLGITRFSSVSKKFIYSESRNWWNK